MNRITILLTFLFSVMTLIAQDKEETFKPSGQAVLKVFSDWHQGFGNQNFKDVSGFALTRAVIGYEYMFSSNISTKVIVDMDDPGAGKLTEVAYLRNAYIAYKDDRLNAYFGVLGMKQFKEQESNWGYRYIYKSAMDHYKFNNSVDAGFYVKYKFLDCLAADVTISNGEGAKKQQDIEGKYRMGYGVSLRIMEGLSLRAYYDILYALESSPGVVNKNQSTIAFFLGYEAKKLRLGMEYDKLDNYKFDGTDDRDIYSVYGSYSFARKYQAFARYDIFEADAAGESENVFIAGLEYSIIKGVNVSPNYRYGDYAFKAPTGEGSYVYINFEYKF